MACGIAFDPLVLDLITSSDVKDIIVSIMGPYGPHALKAIGFLTFIARFRSLRKATP